MIQKEMTQDLKNEALDLIKEIDGNFEKLRNLLDETKHNNLLLKFEENIANIRHSIMNDN